MIDLRELNVDLYSSVTITDERITFPLWNLSGQMIGYQSYRPTGPKGHSKDVLPQDMRYFTYISKIENTSKIAVFGVEQLSRTCSYSNVCFLVEGIFDAVPFHNLNLNCLGLLGVGDRPNKELLNHLRSLGYLLVAVCEDDKAGKNLRKYSDKSLYLENGQDPGDLKTEGVRMFLHENGFDV